MRRSSVENSASRFSKVPQSQSDTITKAHALGITEVSVLFNEQFKETDVDEVLLIIAQLCSESLDMSVDEVWFQDVLENQYFKQFLHMLPDGGQLHEKSIQRLRLYKMMLIAMAKCRIRALGFSEFCQGLCKESKRHSLPAKVTNSANRGLGTVDPKQVLVSRIARWITFLYELQNVRQQLVTSNRDAIEGFQDVVTKLHALEQEKHELTTHLEKMRSEVCLEDLGQLVKNQDQEYAKLRAELEEKKRGHGVVTSRYRKAADALKSQKNKLSGLEQELNMVKTQTDQAKEQLVDSPEELKQAHQLASDTAADALQKLNEAESLWRVHVELAKASTIIASFISKLKYNMDEFEAASQEYEANEKELADVEAKLMGQQNEVQKRMEMVKSQMAIVLQKLESARAREEAIQQANADAERRERDTERRISDLQREHVAEEQAIREAEAECQTRHREFMILRSQLEETLALNQTTDVDLHELRKDLTRQQYKVVDDMRKEVDSFKSELMSIAAISLKTLKGSED